MVDNLSNSDRKKAMQAVKNKGTSLERRLWAMLAGLNMKGWVKNPRLILGNPDVIFEKKHIAIFIDGCFWHGCPICNKPMPINNSIYWERKIRKNIDRANYVNETLSAQGWMIIRIWEHELNNNQFKIEVRNRLKIAY